MAGHGDEPARLSRRSVLQAAAVAAGVLVLGPSCSSSAASTDAASAEPDAWLAVGRDLGSGPAGDDLRARAAELGATIGTVTDRAGVRAALDRLDAESRADFAARRTVLGHGWVLSRTEATVLVAYAKAAA